MIRDIIIEKLKELKYDVEADYREGCFTIDISDLAKEFGIQFNTGYYILVEVKEKDDAFIVSIYRYISNEYDALKDLAIELAKIRGIEFEDESIIWWEEEIVEEAAKLFDEIALKIINDITEALQLGEPYHLCWNRSFDVWVAEFMRPKFGKQGGEA